MRILYITTISGTMYFFKHFINRLTNDENEVDIACGQSDFPVLNPYRKMGCKIYEIGTSRSPLDIKNIQAISKIRRIVKEGKYDIVHCHTPIAAAVTRVACRPLRKNGVRVLYTAHGFHFYDGAPLKNWLLYYPVEWLCAFWTDGLITINSEDYRRAMKRLYAKRVYYVPGVGTNIDGFGGDCNHEIRKEFNIPESAILLLSVGELNKNKNHQVVIKALAQLNNRNIYYIIAGAGAEVPLRKLIQECRLENRVFLAGYRTDIKNFLADSDVYIHPSFREGLSMAVVEAMASEKPCIVSDIRGPQDLIDERGGIMIDPHNIDSTRKAIQGMIDQKNIWIRYGEYNREKAKRFDYKNVDPILDRIYREINEA